jgi:hypothetical protein
VTGACVTPYCHAGSAGLENNADLSVLHDRTARSCRLCHTIGGSTGTLTKTCSTQPACHSTDQFVVHERKHAICLECHYPEGYPIDYGHRSSLQPRGASSFGGGGCAKQTYQSGWEQAYVTPIYTTNWCHGTEADPYTFKILYVHRLPDPTISKADLLPGCGGMSGWYCHGTSDGGQPH